MQTRFYIPEAFFSHTTLICFPPQCWFPCPACVPESCRDHMKPPQHAGHRCLLVWLWWTAGKWPSPLLLRVPVRKSSTGCHHHCCGNDMEAVSRSTWWKMTRFNSSARAWCLGPILLGSKIAQTAVSNREIFEPISLSVAITLLPFYPRLLFLIVQFIPFFLLPPHMLFVPKGAMVVCNLQCICMYYVILYNKWQTGMGRKHNRKKHWRTYILLWEPIQHSRLPELKYVQY